MRRFSAALAFAISAATTLTAQSKPLLTPKDYGKWESVGSGRFSPKGEWFAYSITRNNEENELRIRSGTRDTTIVVLYGSNPAFSVDSKWIAYSVGVSPKEREKLVKDKKPVRNSVVFRNLSTGESTTVSDVTSFVFSADGRFLAMQRYAAEGKHTSDLLVQDLSNNTRLTFGNVGEYAWAETNPLLAFTIDADGGTGNGVQLYDGRKGVVRVLESSTSLYRQLAWRPKSDDLAALRSRVDSAYRDTANVVVAWIGAGSSTSNGRPLDAATASGFPAGMRVADYRALQWSADGKTIYFGVRLREPVADAIKKSDEKVSDVQIWHPNDVRLFEQQRVGLPQDLRRTMLAAWRLGDGKVVPIGTDPNEQSAVLESGRYATEIDRKPYGWGWKFGRNDQDLWIVDLSTGARKRGLEKVRHFYGGSPTGTKVAWSDGKDFWTMDLSTGTRTNLSASLTSGKEPRASFVNRDDDHPNNVPPIISPAGWTKGDGAFIVYDEFNIWSLAPDGSGGKRLTNGAAEGVVHRLVSFARFNASADERAYDLSKPMIVSLLGKKTKKGGYGRLTPAGSVERDVFVDAAIGGLTRADSADVYAYTRQTYEESPNYYLATGGLASAKKITDTNPFQKDYAWGRAELFDFKSTIGVPLQAVLHYPANYDPSKKYPMIVYTYEMLTQNYHRYVAPREQDYYNVTVFTQNGYFVLQPDIVFRPREPGVAVLHSVEPAVLAVIKRGLVDSTRIGHCGHSQGGYEAAFLGTHSKLFATTISGAGITDMISFAGQLHWSGGSSEFDHWETGQFRMEVAPWEDFPAMLRNSPLNKVAEMPAKSMLLEIGGEDGTVDMRQGTLFYNYARRAGKQVVLLLYPGEGHGLGKKENAIDYERRILQWFAHYLKGEPAAKWITEGQSALQRKAILDANK